MIRAALASDHEAIVAVTDAAFEGSEKAIRIAREAEPEISLVWEEDGQILGHTMLTRMEMGEYRPFQLSPLSVMPSHQGRGIGSALVRDGGQVGRLEALRPGPGRVPRDLRLRRFNSVRGAADDLQMEATLQLLAWAGVIAAAAVSAALVFGVLFGS